MSNGLCYWDSSAVLSLLLPDSNSSVAVDHAEREVLHVISSVGAAEVYSVLARLERGRMISSDEAQSARSRFESANWRYSSVAPSRALLCEAAKKWCLKGADLWHLATAMALLQERPHLQLLSFDAALVEAARGEGLSAT